MRRILALRMMAAEFRAGVEAGQRPEEAADVALTKVKAVYGSDPDWPQILETLVEWQLLLSDMPRAACSMCPMIRSGECS